ncbi:MAG: nucleoside transporter [Spirochaetes bacterium]|nr:nucleoside transporter [Spirochaetota bacterium]
MTFQNLTSLFGIFAFLLIAWALSNNRRLVNWRVLGVGLSLMGLFAVFIFVLPVGTTVFLWVNDLVLRVLDASSAGVAFVFGPLASGPGSPGSIGFILATQALPTIIFFSALMAVLYHIGVMPLLVVFFARLFTKPMRISGAESLSCSANIFLGVESALVIRPHLATLTRSELCTILAAGMATVASNVLALYAITLKAQFPAIAGHLVSASFLAIPAAIMTSKLIYPESGQPETLGQHVKPHYEKDPNLFAAIISGSKAGVEVILGIVALLIAMIGLVALLDMLVTQAGVSIGGLFHHPLDLSFKALLGYAFLPFTFLMGIHVDDVRLLSGIIGERLVLTEVASYQDLAKAMAAGLVHHDRSALIATYALCGFTHIPSLAIFVGGTAALAPSRLADLSSVGIRALIAATLACFITASVAGAFYTGGSILMGR